MEHKYKVLYKTEKGLMTFDGNLVLFVDKGSKNNCHEGVAEIIDSTVVTKSTFGFADFRNIHTIIPVNYGVYSTFKDRGVPVHVETAYFRNDAFIKESYANGKVLLKGYLEDGTLAIQEYKYKKDSNELNAFYTRLESKLTDWADITSAVWLTFINSLKSLKCDTGVILKDETFLSTIRGKKIHLVCKAENGLVFVDGKYETLVVWELDGVVSMTWVGRKVNYDAYKCEDITKSLENEIINY